VTGVTRTYPVSLILKDRKCVVVGGGAEAASRASNLREAGANVLVVGEEAFAESDLDDAWLVVQATQDSALAARVAAACQARRIFFCALDQPQNNSYAHLALARAGSLTLAVGTEGRAPALGRRLREELQRVLNEADAAEEVERLATLRETTTPSERRDVLSRAVADVHLTGALRFRKD
jgi:precorrin-2 dehydrogenase/sirohydrochlorin ferrochelatase